MIRLRMWSAGLLCFVGSAVEAHSQDVTFSGRISQVFPAPTTTDSQTTMDPKFTPAAAFDRACPGCGVGTAVKITLDGGRPNGACDGAGSDFCLREYGENQIVVTAGARSWTMKRHYAAVSTSYGYTNNGSKIVIGSVIVIHRVLNRGTGPVTINQFSSLLTAQALIDARGAIVTRANEPFIADYRHVPVPVAVDLIFEPACSDRPSFACAAGAIRMELETVSTRTALASQRVK